MSTYIRLTDFKNSDSKEQGFFKYENRYETKQNDFKKIPGSPIAYLVSEKNIELYKKGIVSDFAEAKEGLKTGDNANFLRLWYEVDRTDTMVHSGTRAFEEIGREVVQSVAFVLQKAE